MKTLLLWDIDGTLTNSGGASRRALTTALFKQFGISGLLDDIDFSGRTDRWIIRQVFAKFGVPATEENFAGYSEAYLGLLPAEMHTPQARVFPGARDLVEAAGRRPGVAQGLLTGNFRRGAEVKLSHHGLWRHFPFGAFGDESEFRNELGPHGLRRARETHGVDFHPSRVWVIGDTPHDVACARAIGANCLAVATGRHSAADLAGSNPTAVMSDLADSQAFWNIIENPSPA